MQAMEEFAEARWVAKLLTQGLLRYRLLQSRVSFGWGKAATSIAKEMKSSPVRMHSIFLMKTMISIYENFSTRSTASLALAVAVPCLFWVSGSIRFS